MSPKNRTRIRTLLAVPSAAVLVLGASQAPTSPPVSVRAPECESFCAENVDYCWFHPGYYSCRYCGCT